MHVIFRESHGLDETETPIDLGQTPADLVVLSFSDSDLGAFAAGWRQGGGPEGKLPGLRLANLAALKHPLSVDTYVETVLKEARGILIRLIGGQSYWPYGLAQVLRVAQAKGIALAVLPADGRVDERLDAHSTLPVSTLRRLSALCDMGGAVAAEAALAQLALAAGHYAGPVPGPKGIPACGAWSPETGVGAAAPDGDGPLVLITFYRSYLVAADLAPVEALFAAFRTRGFRVHGLFASSLKSSEAAEFIATEVTRLTPHAIVNATAFSGKGRSGTSPLDASDAPVFQVALSTSSAGAWEDSSRGLSPSDLAMHVVLPEVDGRILAGVASFKEAEAPDPHLQFARVAHMPLADRVEFIAERVAGWIALRRKPAADRRLALVMSTYPGRDWNAGHAVGLDAPASTRAILDDLRDAGYSVTTDFNIDPSTWAIRWPLKAYRAALDGISPALRRDLDAAWGPVERDRCVDGDAFVFRATQAGNALLALQPERGRSETRSDDYHDLSRVPRHGYVAFYLWLQSNADALVHVGAHGTLEWLPGKSVALSRMCWPEALIGSLPLIYPFIVNDPGEAAQAKRRIGAVTLGHVPPPLKSSGTPERLARLEALLDEYSTADGLDPARRDRLTGDIRDEARALGVEADLGIDEGDCASRAIPSIDRFVCDVKESQYGDGLHVWGRSDGDAEPDARASAEAERLSLLAALEGRRIPPGPSGSPWRGRRDVLPTGRNLYATDPRAVPSRAAYMQGRRLADEFVRHHMQTEGDHPRTLLLDLWGSATMRTAGEEFAMGLALMGVRPAWDEGTERVSGIEVVPIAELEHPRVDVTLRVSGLFRDVFPTLTTLFNQAVRALAARDETPDWNPFAGRNANARVFGPAPGQFGLDMAGPLARFDDIARHEAGEAWLAASAWALDGDDAREDYAGLVDRVREAAHFVHLQDLPETDLLLAEDYASHEAGFAAAQGVTGGHASLWHLDNTDPHRPRTRSLGEEIARVVHARAAHPGWIAGMRRHGFRGAAEIAATLRNLAAFAQLAHAVEPHLFDLYYEATVGDAETCDFLARDNPQALADMKACFDELHAAGLWVSRRNSIRAELRAQA